MASSFSVDTNKINGLQNLAGTGAGLSASMSATPAPMPAPSPAFGGISGP